MNFTYSGDFADFELKTNMTGGIFVECQSSLKWSKMERLGELLIFVALRGFLAKIRNHLTLRAKRATFTFGVEKSLLKMQKWSILASFWKLKAYGQTVLPDRSTLIGQKIEKFKCGILSGQKIIKNAKIGQYWWVFENLKLAVKQYYQTGHFIRT